MVDLPLLNALLPIFAVILAGALFNRFHFPGSAFWPAAEKLTYFVLFPSLLFYSTATASLGNLAITPLFAALSFAVLLMVGLLFLLRKWFTTDDRGFSSVFQGSIRFNTYVGFALVYALYGTEGVTWAAVTIAILIPLVNLLSVSVIVHATRRGANAATFLLTILRTPPFIACLAGISVNGLGIVLPTPALELLQLFGRASLPLGLLAVGASLRTASFSKNGVTTGVTCFMKLFCLPLLAWMSCGLFQIDSLAAQVAVLFAALPGSASSYILARQLGGDSDLMANIVTAQIAVSLFSLPVVLSLISA